MLGNYLQYSAVEIDFKIPHQLFSQHFAPIANHEAALTPAEKDVVKDTIPDRIMAFSTGRLCAKAALHTLGATTDEIRRGIHKEPQWPAGFTGSISHSPALAGAVVARSHDIRAVGLDIETTGRVLPAMWNTIFTPLEQQYLKDQAATDQSFLTTLFFSMKESFYKLQFPLTKHPLWFTDVEIHAQGTGFKLCLLHALPATKQLPTWTNMYFARYQNQVTSLCLLEA